MKPWERSWADPSETERQSVLADQDKKLGLPSGLTRAQIEQESGNNPNAVSKAGARGWAQLMPKTQATLEARLGRKIDPSNFDDAMLAHEMVMKENLARFKSPDAALKAYNNGWNPEKWNNPETAGYVPAIKARMKPESKKKPWERDWEDVQPAQATTEPIAPAPPVGPIEIKPTTPNKAGGVEAFLRGAGRGVADLVDGGAYLLDKGLGKAGVDTTGINNSANALLNKILPSGLANALIAPGSVSDINKASEAAYKDVVGDSGAATAGRIGGNIGTAFIPGTGQAKLMTLASGLWKAGGIANKGKSLGTAAGLGAGQGAVLNTKTDDDSAAKNALLGAVGGTAGQVIAPPAKAGVQGVGAMIDPFTKGGIDRIVARGIEQFKTGAGKPGYTAPVDGFKPTLAQATQDPGLAQLTRVIQSASPDAASALSQRSQSNNTALVDAIRGVAGDDTAKAATIQARKQATAPLYAVVDKSTSTPELTGIRALIDGIVNKQSGRPAVQGPLADIQAMIPDGATPGVLQNVVKSIGDKVNAKAADGSPANIAALRELGVVKQKIEQAIGRESPEYLSAQKLYADLSKPVNSQRAAEQLLAKSSSSVVDPVTGNPMLYAEKFSRALNNGDSLVKNVTGRKTLGGLENNVTSEAMQQFNSIKQALDLVASAEKAGSIGGSRTAQIGAGQNLLSQTLGPLGLGGMAGAPQIGVISRLLNFAAKSQDPKIHQRFTDILLDPSLMAQLPKQGGGSPALNSAMQRALAGGGAIGLPASQQ